MSALWIIAAVSIGAASAPGAASPRPRPKPRNSRPARTWTWRPGIARSALGRLHHDPAAAGRANFWQAGEMIGVFGARIPDDDARKIVDYLNSAYRAQRSRWGSALGLGIGLKGKNWQDNSNVRPSDSPSGLSS